MLVELAHEVVHAMLPSWCIVCDRPLPWRRRRASCCESCWAALPKIIGTKCRTCALPLSGAPGVQCLSCQGRDSTIDWADAWGHYRGGLEQILHAFKFQRHDFLAGALAELLEETMIAHDERAFDAIVPVPMFRAKERRRGYNQAALLARALSRATSTVCDGRLLEKIAERETQSLLPRARRAANVRGVFRAQNVADRSILLIDDICTTGETLRACATELRKKGAARVSAITVARVA